MSRRILLLRGGLLGALEVARLVKARVLLHHRIVLIVRRMRIIVHVRLLERRVGLWVGHEIVGYLWHVLQLCHGRLL